MRKLQFSLLLCLVLGWSVADALPSGERRTGGRPGQDTAHESETLPPGFLCDQCRDFEEYPMDVVAVVYNGFFGDNPWLLDSIIGFPMRFYALDGSSVLVWFEGVIFDMPTLLPNLMDVLVRMPNGQVLRFTIMQGGPDLPVGVADAAPNSGSAGGCSCGGNGGGGDYEEPDDFDEIEIEDDRVGVVDIIDPDEDGGFPDWELEL